MYLLYTFMYYFSFRWIRKILWWVFFKIIIILRFCLKIIRFIQTRLLFVYIILYDMGIPNKIVGCTINKYPRFTTRNSYYSYLRPGLRRFPLFYKIIKREQYFVLTIPWKKKDWVDNIRQCGTIIYTFLFFHQQN